MHILDKQSNVCEKLFMFDRKFFFNLKASEAVKKLSNFCSPSQIVSTSTTIKRKHYKKLKMSQKLEFFSIRHS